MSALNKLVTLIPPPPGPFAYDWEWAEKELGTALPADYRQLCETYGPGDFDETYSLWVPLGSGSGMDLIALAREEADIMRSVRDEFIKDGSALLAVFPEPGGLLAWGSVPIGLGLCWQTGGEPDRWPVVVSDDKSLTGDTWRHDGTISEFLLAVFAGQVEVPYLAGTEWGRGDPPLFQPITAEVAD